jgi:phosphohistidine phosphatase
MNLILWRHADAEPGSDDASRPLTRKGLKQAERVAAWLKQHLPHDARVIVSPALRAQETARALSRDYETVAQLGTDATPAEILTVAGWPKRNETVVIVGHQPSLGATAALVLTGGVAPWRVKKGAVWWISIERGDAMPSLVAVTGPELL